MTSIGVDEFVFHKDENGVIYSGGYQINSILMKQGLSPMITLNQNQKGGEKNVSDLFDHLVVPNWALAFPFTKGGAKKNNIDEEDEGNEIIGEDIHSKLLSMLTVNPSNERKNHKSKKTNKKNMFNKTKKNEKHKN